MPQTLSRDPLKNARHMGFRRSGTVLAAALIYLLLAMHLQAQTSAAPNAEPVNPHATPEARALLREMDELSGHATLTGEHNFPNDVSRWSDRIYDLTGKYPALFGEDFGFSGGGDKDSTLSRSEMIREVERQYRRGSVIALCWHAVPPTKDEPVTFQGSILSHLTDYEWSELLTPGTRLHARWETQADVIAGYLKQLQAAGVPVLFRPYHEMNGNWFWWGGRPGPQGSSALYRMIYDRFVNVHHLDNLIWVWNVNSPSSNAGDVALYDPGHAYADLYTLDVYGAFEQSYYDSMLRLAGNKPIALAEVGTMPSLATFAQQPRWAYFMIWSGFAEGPNSPEALQANFHAPALLTLGDAALQKWVPAPRQTLNPEPVTAKASPAARALLTSLRVPKQPTATASSAPAQGTAAIRVEQADLSRETDVAALVVKAKQIEAGGAHMLLNWLSPSPADVTGRSRNGALTEFEWGELLTDGTHLHERWLAEIDAAAAVVSRLEKAGVAVLWNPLPGSNDSADRDHNGKKEMWWAGRSGIHGSAALYRSVFDRMATRPGHEGLIWIWSAVPGGATAMNAPGEFFPGLLYVDALQVLVDKPEGVSRAIYAFRGVGLGKPVGATVVAEPAALSRATNLPEDVAWLASGSTPADTSKAPQ